MAVMLHTLLSVVLVMVGSKMATGQWHRSQFPNPQSEDHRLCGRDEKSYVCDPNGKLTVEDANQLDNAIKRIMKETRCPCSALTCKHDHSGYTIGIAIAPNISSDAKMKAIAEGNANYKKDESSKTRLSETQKFAYTLLINWELGKCKDDIIIVYDPVNFSLFTLGGETAMDRLPPALIGDITMKNMDAFNGPNPYSGLQKMLADFRLALMQKYEANRVYSYQPKAAASVSGASSLAPISFLSLLGVLIYSLW